MLTSAARGWARRLALGVILVTCVGGAADVLVGRPPGDCAVVDNMMRTYASLQAASQRGVVTDPRGALAEARAAATLQTQARGVVREPLRTAAVEFADSIAQSARAQRQDAEKPPELDPFDVVLPEIDPAELHASDVLYGAAHVLLAACPAVPPPMGLS